MIMADAEPDFDTLACARKLREGGVEAKQAEAHAEAARTIRAGLATKADLDSLETRLPGSAGVSPASLFLRASRACWRDAPRIREGKLAPRGGRNRFAASLYAKMRTAGRWPSRLRGAPRRVMFAA